MQRPSHSPMICCLICCFWESLLSVQVWWNECTHTSVCGEGVGVVPRQLRTITGSRIPICRFRCDNSHIWKAMAFSLRERQRILKPRVLKVWVKEWVSEWVSEVAQLCPTLCNPMDCSLTRFLRPWDFPGKNTGVGCHCLLQEIFPTQGLNPGLPHCRQTLYCLSHQGR